MRRPPTPGDRGRSAAGKLEHVQAPPAKSNAPPLSLGSSSPKKIPKTKDQKNISRNEKIQKNTNKSKTIQKHIKEIQTKHPTKIQKPN